MNNLNLDILKLELNSNPIIVLNKMYETRINKFYKR